MTSLITSILVLSRWRANIVVAQYLWAMTEAAEIHREREPEGTQRVRTQAVLLLTLTLRLTFDLSTQNRIICKISHGHSLCQVWTFWDHSCLSYAPNIIVKNALIDPVTLTFDLWTPNYVTLFPTPSLNTLGSLSFELCCKQTDRQTDRQKAPNALSTPTDIVGTKLPVNVNDYILYVHNNRSSGRVVVATVTYRSTTVHSCCSCPSENHKKTPSAWMSCRPDVWRLMRCLP